ncbi:MAG: hypothetical protein SR1Q5_01045 [Quinella sp. 1Q5]|nr:hypothetical protein [Quinella sp. 1Q5]
MLDFSAYLKPSAGAFLAISRNDAIYHFEKSDILDFPFCTSKSPPKPFSSLKSSFKASKAVSTAQNHFQRSEIRFTAPKSLLAGNFTLAANFSLGR